MGPRLDSRGNMLSLIGTKFGYPASMGPRLDSRGNREGKSHFLAACELQWGRDLIVAETAVGDVAAAATEGASMGPRLDSRGNDHFRADHRQLGGGFNGAAT